jgi:Fur family transcriptional regulator, stress-responsive regulator
MLTTIPVAQCPAMIKEVQPSMPSNSLRRSDPNSLSLLQRLQRRGWRLTSQRRVIAEAMEGDHVHLTAEEVYERASSRLPEISRATVYNTLGELARLGEVAEVALGSGIRRYDPQTADRHQHMVCERCGATRDVHPTGEGRLSLPASEGDRFKLSRVEIVFWGVCSDCANVE